MKDKAELKKYNQQYRIKNRERLKALDKIRYEQRKGDPETKKKRKLWENKNKIKIVEYQKEYRKNNKIYLRQQKLIRLYEIKELVLKEFGNKCNCCGETIREFLTIDHINGRKGEKTRSTGKKLWAKVWMEGCPKDKYALLCFNCNCAKGIYGSCPHNNQPLKRKR
jgi:hypothetical protein